MPYIGNSPANNVRGRFYYTASASQTLFSGADSNGKTLAYQDGGYVDVYLNGVLLQDTTDYTATTKTSVTLTSGATAGDLVEIVAYGIFSVADSVSALSGGTFEGAVVVNNNFTVDNGTIKLDGNYPVGTGNVALGDAALDDASLSGGYNTAIGGNALTSNTTAQFNLAVGFEALRDNTTGANNVALGGYQALIQNTTGSNNVAVGRAALQANTTASYNTAVGYQAGYSNTTGAAQTFIGVNAGYSVTTGTDNTMLGADAGYATTTGNYNTGLGKQALRFNTTANSNTVVGYQAGYSNTTDSSNTFIGNLAGYTFNANSGTNTYNTFVGNQAGAYTTTGTVNTFLGYGAGALITTGAKNTVIGTYNGNQNGLDIRTSSNNIVLSDGDGNPRTHINSTGHHFISPDLSTMGNSGNKHVTANTVTGNYIQIFEHSAASSNVYGLFVNFYAGSPNDNVRTFIACQDSTAARFYVRSNGNVVNVNNSYGAISDEKLKENIVDSGSQWDDIKALRVRKYSMKEDALDAPNRLGVIAQEVEAAGMSGLVIESPDQDKDLNDLGTVTKSVNYSVLYMKAVKALQEAMERIETLEAKVAALETP